MKIVLDIIVISSGKLIQNISNFIANCKVESDKLLSFNDTIHNNSF